MPFGNTQVDKILQWQYL